MCRTQPTHLFCCGSGSVVLESFGDDAAWTGEDALTMVAWWHADAVRLLSLQGRRGWGGRTRPYAPHIMRCYVCSFWQLSRRAVACWLQVREPSADLGEKTKKKKKKKKRWDGMEHRVWSTVCRVEYYTEP